MEDANPTRQNAHPEITPAYIRDMQQGLQAVADFRAAQTALYDLFPCMTHPEDLPPAPLYDSFPDLPF